MRLAKTVMLAAAAMLAGLFFQAFPPAGAAGAAADTLRNPLASTVQYAADVTYSSKKINGKGRIYHAAPGLERRDVTMMGHDSVMIVKPNEVLILVPQMNVAMRLPVVEDPIVMINRGAEKVRFSKLGSETVNGEKADKYRMEGEAKGLLWITADGIPVKAEIPLEGDVMRYDVLNIKRGAQPESLFALPKGMTIVDAQKMGRMTDQNSQTD